MTKFAASGNANLATWNLKDLIQGKVKAHSAKHFTLIAPKGIAYKFGGTGFTGFDQSGLPKHGTITSMAMAGPKSTYQISGIHLSANALHKFAAHDNVAGLEKAIFSGKDAFSLANAHTVKIDGLGGNDTFKFAGNFKAADRIDGGSGKDTLHLAGDYSHGVKFGAATIQNIEKIGLAGGHSYNLTLNDGNIAANHTLTIDAKKLGTGDKLTVNDAAETNGNLHVTGGKGNDHVTTGAGDNTVALGAGRDTFTAGSGSDHVNGGAGNDTFNFGANFGSGDSVNGGAGNDTLVLSGNYAGTASLVLSQSNVSGIEHVDLGAGHSYTVSLGNDLPQATLDVNGADLKVGDVLNVDGSAATATALDLVGGAGNDVLTGGGAVSTLIGGLGADTLTGGSGADNFVYNTVADSTGSAMDTINGFNANTDTITLPDSVTGIDTSLLGTTLNNLGQLGSLLGAGQLGADHATILTPLLGNLAGETFMVIDQNGQAGYQAGQDLVVQLENATHLGNLDLGNFLGS